MNYNAFFDNRLQKLHETGHYRIFAKIERLQGDFPYALLHHEHGQERITVWCGNDYLGMGQHPDVIEAIENSLRQCGAGSGGTRNISGTNIQHVLLEAELADLHDKEAALIFTSGYVANETTLWTLGSLLPGCVFFSDSENHASMIHGIRNSGARKVIFRHNDVAHLRECLEACDPHVPKIIAFESVYSMDGDISPIEEICDLAKEFNALTFLDEVHGVGMYGAKGGGIAQMRHIAHKADIIQGTLGKAFGLIGGYITGSTELVDFIRSFAPGFIFTTSLAPYIAAGALTSVRHLKKSHEERVRHHANALYLKKKLTHAGIPFMQGESHIIPVIVGDAKLCKEIANTLLYRDKIYAQPINYPTVPMGTERLRLTPSALHTFEMSDHLCEALVRIWEEKGLTKADEAA